MAKQELFGQFVNLRAGSIYWAFKRDDHVKECKLDRRFPVYVGQDFNIDNMCNCYVQKIDGIYRVCQETVLNEHNSNTDTAATKIIKDLNGYNKMVIPDSTAKARSTKAESGVTDITLLKDYGLTVIPTVNPLIRDRQNSLNNVLKKNMMIIDPSCKNLIKELETLSSRDTEGLVSHVAVSLGYVVWKFDPLKTMRPARVTKYI